MEIEYKLVEDFGRIITGKTPSTEKAEYWGGSIPFITPTDISGYDMRYIIDTERQISALGACTQNKTILPPNAICVSCIASIGKMCLTSAKESITNQQINSIIVNKDYDYRYIFYLLRYFLPFLQLIGGGTGSGTPIISKGKFSKLKYPICKDVLLQRRIADILSTYDNLIEINNKRIKVLEQMAENLYKEWFVRFRFPGHETAEFENGIPKGWEYCAVDSLSTVLQRGISPNYDDNGELTVISQKCIRQNIMDIREARRQTKVFKTELNLQDGDAVICSTGTGTLGRVGQVYGEFPNTTFDSHVTLVRAKDTVGKHYLYWTLKEMEPWFMNMGVGSTNQQELYRGTIKNAKALKSREDVMRLFDSVVEPIHRSIIGLIKTQEILTRQRDLLLPRLMSGKLEV